MEVEAGLAGVSRCLAGGQEGAWSVVAGRTRVQASRGGREMSSLRGGKGWGRLQGEKKKASLRQNDTNHTLSRQFAGMVQTLVVIVMLHRTSWQPDSVGVGLGGGASGLSGISRLMGASKSGMCDLLIIEWIEGELVLELVLEFSREPSLE